MDQCAKDKINAIIKNFAMRIAQQKQEHCETCRYGHTLITHCGHEKAAEICNLLTEISRSSNIKIRCENWRNMICGCNQKN